MRRNRLILLAIWIMSVIGISFYGGAVIYGFFYFVTFVPVVCLIYLIYVYFSFTVFQKIIIKDVVVGNKIPYYFTLRNDSIFTFSSVKINFYSSFSKVYDIETDACYELLPHTGITKEASVECFYRGDYEIGIKNIIVTDFLNLFSLRFVPHETVKASVKPATIIPSDIKNFDFNLAVLRESMYKKSYPDTVVRDYEYGDSMRLINWKASAREATLKVRTLIAEEKNGVSILMDTHRISSEDRIYLPTENKILELTLALCYYLADKNISAGVHYISDTYRKIEFDKASEYMNIYSALSRTYFTPEATADSLCEYAGKYLNFADTQIAVFILTSLSRSVLRLIDRLSGESIQIIIFLVGDDVGEDICLPEGLRLTVRNVRSNDDIKEVL